MTDKKSQEDKDTRDAFDLAMIIQEQLRQNDYSDFVASCAFGWLLGQMAKNDVWLDECLENVKGAAQASLWAREDNGLV